MKGENRAMLDRAFEPSLVALNDWRDEVAGSNSFWQRGKRLVFRVPHYKTGEELAAMVAAAKAPR